MAERKTIDFLLTFDHDTGKLIGLKKFRNIAQALKAYSEREEQYRNNSRVEVVLLGADSIDAIKVTHSNYFEDTAFVDLVARLGLLERVQKSVLASLETPPWECSGEASNFTHHQEAGRSRQIVTRKAGAGRVLSGNCHKRRRRRHRGPTQPTL